MLVETTSPGALSSSFIFCEANTRLHRSSPIAFGIRQSEPDDYLDTIKHFHEEETSSKQGFAKVRKPIGVGKTSEGEINDTGKLESKLERFKDLFEKELINENEYEKLKKQILGID